MTSVPEEAKPEPLHPWLVLLAATILPGAGHMLLRQPQRALMFLFFIAVFGWVSLRLMPDSASFVGRHAGGILIYGFSILDAYRLARIRHEVWRQSRARP